MNKIIGNGREATPGRSAAEQRADYARALEEEREQLKAQGKADRVKQVDAELKRVRGESGGPAGRQAPPDQAAAPAPVKAAARKPAKKAAAKKA